MTVTHDVAQRVDTKLAELWQAEQDADTRIGQSLAALHRADGQRSGWGRTAQWPVDDETTEASIRAQLADQTSRFWFTTSDGRTIRIYTGEAAQRAIDELDAARLASFRAREEAKPLEAIYAEHRWSRFFLVQNTGGHVHSSMSCSTTFPTTRWGWLPTLSGLGEDAAVEQEGTRLCSVCFPSAPVEWTLGLPAKVDPKRCPGSGQPAVNVSYRYQTPRGTCSVCGTSVAASRGTGTARNHHTPKA